MMETMVRVVALEMVRYDPALVCIPKIESKGFTSGLNLG